MITKGMQQYIFYYELMGINHISEKSGDSV